MFKKTFSALVVSSVLFGGAAFAAAPTTPSGQTAAQTTGDQKVEKTVAKTDTVKAHHKVTHKQAAATATATKVKSTQTSAGETPAKSN